MKKFLTKLLAAMMSFVLVFSFAACNTKVSKAKIIDNAVTALLDAETLHLSLHDASFSMGESMLLGNSDISAKISGDCYVRKTEKGYDVSAKLYLYVSMAEIGAVAGEDASSEPTMKEYQDNIFVSLEFYYVDEALYTCSQNFYQAVVDNAGYEDFDAYAEDPANKDAVVYTDLITDFSGIDAAIGNVQEGDEGFESRVDVKKTFRYANSLDALIDELNEKVPVLKQLGLSSLDDFVSILKNAGTSVSELADGKIKKNKDGTREITAVLDAKALFDNVVAFLNDNANNTLGKALNNLLGKEDNYIESLVDRLFPAEAGKGLTINAFIAEIDKMFEELEADVTVKEIIDEIQSVTGLTTQQIADVVNPLLQSVLGGSGISVSINPKEGETLYDTLARTAFDMIGVDTILGFIPMDSGEKLNSATINAMLKMYLSDPEVTLSAILSSFETPIMEVLNSIEVERGAVNFGFVFDKENKLTEFSLGGDIGVNASMAMGESENAQQPAMMTLLDINASAKMTIEYVADAAGFAVPADWQPVVVESDETLKVGEMIAVGDMFKDVVSEEELSKFTGVSQCSVYVIAPDGYIREAKSLDYDLIGLNMTGQELMFKFNVVPDDCANVCLIMELDKTYVLKLKAPVVATDVQA